MLIASPAFVKRAKSTIAGCFSLVLALSVQAAELESFESCTLVENDWADGDSFEVKMPDGSKKVFRLYYVDCIETGVSTDSDKRRLRQQSRYFGLDDFRVTHGFGLDATAFTKTQLSKPFTVHTAFADARGRSGKPRYYCFITTAEGKDLAQLLVSTGYARAFGVGREMPDGTSREEHEAFLSDIELAAAVRKMGAWSKSNPDAIVEMRKEERDEDRGLDAIEEALGEESLPKPPEESVELNKCSLEELVSTGLREALADAAIQMRPFEKVEDLLKVKGIGPVTLKKVRPYLFITPTPLAKNASSNSQTK